MTERTTTRIKRVTRTTRATTKVTDMDQPNWDSLKEGASETVQKAAQAAKSSVPWLPSFECEKCGSGCRAGEAYDPIEGAFHSGTGGKRPAWICDNCGAVYRREESKGVLTLSRK